jgi:hypothetical protein
VSHLVYARSIENNKKVDNLVPEEFAEMQLPTQITYLVTKNDAATIVFLIDFNHCQLGNCNIRVKSKISMFYEMKRNEILQIAKEVFA